MLDELVEPFSQRCPELVGRHHGAIDHWAASDIDDILLDVYPRKAMVAAEDVNDIIDGFAAFLRFLGEERIISSNQGQRLATTVETLETQFRDTLADESTWSFGKRLCSQAVAEGVALDDPDQVQAFMDQFDQRPQSERQEILGDMGSPAPQLPPFPPVVLPERATLERMALDTPVMQHAAGGLRG